MKYVYTIISLVCLGTFLFYGHKSPVGQLPPVVDFMNPYTGWWQQADRPRLARRLFTGPVEKDIQIVFDDNLIPHIYAENYQDAVYAQGILHAHFRLWQMDITQRATTGRLSEIVGKRALEADEEKRRMGLKSLGEHLIRQAIQDPEIKKLLSTYTEGVNHLISQMSKGSYPLEYKLLQYEPEPWTITHSGAVAASLVHNLCFRNEDLENTAIVQNYGEAFFQKYYPAWNPRQKPIIQKNYGNETYSQSPIKTISDKTTTRWPQPDPSIGSNNWAVHRSKTKNQNNILANDPHLGLSLPSLWYEVHIHLPDRQIYGVSFPGIPGIVLGFNDKIAWGSTNVSHDVADWIQPVWKDTSSWTYLYQGEWLEAELEEEVIYIRDEDSVSIKIPQTRLGRIPYPESDHDLSRMAFYWGPLQTSGANLFKTFIGFNKAGNYTAFKSALNTYTFPAQNFVFADRKDTVALHVQGHLPLRSRGLGTFVSDSLSSPVFHSKIPQEELPHEINPNRGFVSSANQHSTYPQYPYPYRGFFDGFRGRTLDSLLRSKAVLSFDDMKQIQLSNFSLEAKEALPILLENLDSTILARSTHVKTLKTWDYTYRSGEKAATLFSLWWEAVQKNIYSEWKVEKTPDSWRLIQIMDNSPQDTLYRMHSDSTRWGISNIVSSSYEEAVQEFENMPNQDWYTHKATQIPHLGKIDAFSTPVLQNGGMKNALNAMKKNKGPSWRMIVEMGDTIKAVGVYPGGQSGNPGSHFYENFVEDWTQGNYHSLDLVEIDDWNERVVKWEIKAD